jgi:2-polyprenyl-3-methyl-5-hydroxy-6-metoxy-1,4-benzoquinol methylase
VTTRDERGARDRFRQTYAVPTSELTAAIERRVLGAPAAWGANGYTTVQQADELGQRLALAHGDRLLDVGTGRGWPGLYLATTTGCSVVGTDLPVEGLVAATTRAHEEGLAGRAALVAASAAHLPFAVSTAAFDAVVLTDVLC